MSFTKPRLLWEQELYTGFTYTQVDDKFFYFPANVSIFNYN